MPEFELTWEGRVREVYVTEAETEEEARAKWPNDVTITLSESYDGEIVSVEEVS